MQKNKSLKPGALQDEQEPTEYLQKSSPSRLQWRKHSFVFDCMKGWQAGLQAALTWKIHIKVDDLGLQLNSKQATFTLSLRFMCNLKGECSFLV